MAYIGYNQQAGYDQQNDEPRSNMTWLDYLIVSNPQGVMKVLNKYGYTGYLAPQDIDELYEVCQDLIEKYGEEVIVELLKSHPLYDVIADICKEESKVKVSFKNASGVESQIVTTIRTINYRKLIMDLMVIIGAIYVANYFWSYINKE